MHAGARRRGPFDRRRDARRCGAFGATTCSPREAVRPGVTTWLDEADGLGLRARDRVELGARVGRAAARPVRASRRASPTSCASAMDSRPSPRPTRTSRRARRSVSTGRRARDRRLAARRRGREGRGTALRRGAARDHRAARPVARRPPARRHSPTRSLRDVLGELATLAATAPGAVALPLVERPRDLVLVVRRRAATAARRRDPCGPRAPPSMSQVVREELIRAVVAVAGADRRSIAAALAGAGAHQERVVVVRADPAAGGRGRVGRRAAGRTGRCGTGFDVWTGASDRDRAGPERATARSRASARAVAASMRMRPQRRELCVECGPLGATSSRTLRCFARWASQIARRCSFEVLDRGREFVDRVADSSALACPTSCGPAARVQSRRLLNDRVAARRGVRLVEHRPRVQSAILRVRGDVRFGVDGLSFDLCDAGVESRPRWSARRTNAARSSSTAAAGRSDPVSLCVDACARDRRNERERGDARDRDEDGSTLSSRQHGASVVLRHTGAAPDAHLRRGAGA